MRWSIIRVIWVRELRDQLRDRRTLFMIAVLPILLYPLAGVGLMELAAGFSQKPQVVGVYGVENLAAGGRRRFRRCSTKTRTAACKSRRPTSIIPTTRRRLKQGKAIAADPVLARLTADPAAGPSDDFAAYRKPLDDHSVDLVVVVPPDFARRLRDDDHPSLIVLDRDSDETSRSRQRPIHRHPQPLEKGDEGSPL